MHLGLAIRRRRWSRDCCGRSRRPGLEQPQARLGGAGAGTGAVTVSGDVGEAVGRYLRLRVRPRPVSAGSSRRQRQPAAPVWATSGQWCRHAGFPGCAPVVHSGDGGQAVPRPPAVVPVSWTCSSVSGSSRGDPVGEARPASGTERRRHSTTSHGEHGNRDRAHGDHAASAAADRGQSPARRRRSFVPCRSPGSRSRRARAAGRSPIVGDRRAASPDTTSRARRAAAIRRGGGGRPARASR